MPTILLTRNLTGLPLQSYMSQPCIFPHTLPSLVPQSLFSLFQGLVDVTWFIGHGLAVAATTFV